MEPRRSGLVHTWDSPRRCFQYSYIPRYNETLEIVELPFGSINPPDNGGRKLSLQDLPPEVAAEINISLGSSGMYYYTLTWWERRMRDLGYWQDRAGKRLKIWGLKLRILGNQVKMVLRTVNYWKLKAVLKLAMARNWCKLRYIDAKVWVLTLLIGDRNE